MSGPLTNAYCNGVAPRRWLLLLWLLAPSVAVAAVQQYFITGAVNGTMSSYTGLPDGTPFAGTYQFDDVTADSNGSAQVGNYATGQFFVNLGPVEGQITFDQNASIVVSDNVSPFGFTTDDSFAINAQPGARNTPNIPNDVQSFPSLFYRTSSFGSDPTVLTDDSLTGVPHVAGAPWDPNDQLISLQLSAVGGDCPAFTSSCFLRMDIATVDPAFDLTVTKSGSATGMVSSTPFGVDCGGTCSALMGGTVVLSAVPDVPSTITWTGCDSINGAADQCTVAMTSARSVNVQFEVIIPEFNLTVTKSGSGSGSVTSNPSGIDCGATCSALLGGSVVLSAVPDVPSTITWSGCDSINGAGDQCTVSMNADRTVAVAFQEIVAGPIPTLTSFSRILMMGLLALAGLAVLGLRRQH